MKWSKYQTAIFDEARSGSGHVAVVARAGTGKTSSLLESLKRLPERNVLLCAFNKAIATEMQGSAPRYVMTSTLHSLGLRAHRHNTKHPIRVDPNKSIDIIQKVLAGKRYSSMVASHTNPIRYMWDVTHRVNKAVGLAKNIGAAEQKDVECCVTALDLDIDPRCPAELLGAAAVETMTEAAKQKTVLDFDDMVWFPYIFRYGEHAGTELPQFDVVMVDEAQDLNPVQLWLVRQMRANGRSISFLDDRQTIYGFRGASRETLDQLINKDSVRLSLPISYRCPVAVIEQARKIVSDIEPAPRAISGKVSLVEYQDLLVNARPGDFVLSRTNGPLMCCCLALLSRGISAVVTGKDLSKQLIDMVKNSKAHNHTALLCWVHKWLADQSRQYGADRPARYERAKDLAATLVALMRHTRTIDELKLKIQTLFCAEGNDVDKVVCSTVHKAKGLERDRVWMLHKTFGYPIAHPWQQSWDEENIWYVAVTRSRNELFFVESDVKEMIDHHPTHKKARVWKTTPKSKTLRNKFEF